MYLTTNMSDSLQYSFIELLHRQNLLAAMKCCDLVFERRTKEDGDAILNILRGMSEKIIRSNFIHNGMRMDLVDDHLKTKGTSGKGNKKYKKRSPPHCSSQYRPGFLCNNSPRKSEKINERLVEEMLVSFENSDTSSLMTCLKTNYNLQMFLFFCVDEKLVISKKDEKEMGIRRKAMSAKEMEMLTISLDRYNLLPPDDRSQEETCGAESNIRTVEKISDAVKNIWRRLFPYFEWDDFSLFVSLFLIEMRDSTEKGTLKSFRTYAMRENHLGKLSDKLLQKS